MDCPDPLALATFYSGLLGQPIPHLQLAGPGRLGCAQRNLGSSRV